MRAPPAILFPAWASSNEPYWVSSRERLGIEVAPSGWERLSAEVDYNLTDIKQHELFQRYRYVAQ
jgi:hypothetical protein